MNSLRARLLIGLLGSMILVQSLVYALIYAKIEDEIDDLFDGELERTALSLASGNAPLPVATPHREVENPQEGMRVAIWQHGAAQPRWQGEPLGALPRNTAAGFSKIVIDGQQWRLFGAASDGRYVVAAQPADVRNVAARAITRRILVPSSSVLPVAALMIWLAVSFGLRPLVRITEALLARSDRDLAPLPTRRLPPDLAPLVRALNGLMLRMDAILKTQRNFIADAAHELLTPLTALRLQTQLLARADSTARRREVVAELQGGVSRTLQLASQLLALARHGGDAGGREFCPLDLATLVRNVLAINAPLAHAKSVRADLVVEGPCVIRGDEEALNTLLSNLVENAIKYSELDGTVRVSLQGDDRRVSVSVEDSGPGIPPQERERVFDRFYRRSGHTASGNGLGLAIAREIATRHGTAIRLEGSVALGGLRAVLEFAASEADARPTGRLPQVA
jgi:signal transduction histidine kinase